METQAYKNGKKLYIITCVLLGTFLCFLIAYHVFDLQFSGHLNMCGFIYFLHLYCPGCGGTRSVDYLLHGQLFNSFASHPLILYLVALFLSYFLPATYTYAIKRNGRKYYRFRPWTLYLMLAVILVFFVGRNLALVFLGYDFLGNCKNYWL